MKLIFATRPSALARWQTNFIIDQLKAVWSGLNCEQLVITTRGDLVLDKPLPEIGGKGLFTLELEEALRNSEVHAAVHSLKDLPTEDSPGLTIGVIPGRADVRDVLINPAGKSIDELPAGAVLGTSSNRRKAQILAYRPDMVIKDIRGNVDTRIRKVQEGQYDAIILAAAGVERLGMQEYISQYLSLDIMLPAPGQGALAVQCRQDDQETISYLTALASMDAYLAVTAERAFLECLGGGCSLPVGAYATVVDGQINLRCIVAAIDGQRSIKVEGQGNDPEALGKQLAVKALDEGAAEVML